MTNKRCKKCNQDKPLSLFGIHFKMKDGHLNTCKSCVYSYITEWRKDNKEKRKKEYLRRKPKLGITRTMEEYITELKKNAKGRKASLLEYSAKRRSRTIKTKMTEFDLLVQSEAIHLCLLREKITKTKWHVDHIVPLNHTQACGLHNGYNLQVAPASWNINKRNRNMNFYLG